MKSAINEAEHLGNVGTRAPRYENIIVILITKSFPSMVTPDVIVCPNIRPEHSFTRSR